MIKVFETFSGYGGWSWGLKKANIEFEVVGHSEIDKYAVQCYNQNFPNIKNYGDISKIMPEDLPDFDLLCTSPPCQDVSIAGKRDLSKGRSTLVEYIFRIIEVKKPKWVVYENVKGLLSMKEFWEYIKNEFRKSGYTIAYKVLNTKDYGVPQNRERIFIVAFRNDIYVPFKFQFPEKEPLKLLLKDILEEEVDEKYYLKQEQTEKLLKGIVNNQRSCISVLQKNDFSGTLLSRDYKSSKCVDIKDLIGLKNRNFSSSAKVLDVEGVSPTLQACMGMGGNQVNYVYEMSNRVYNPNGIAPTLTKVSGGNQEKKIILYDAYNNSLLKDNKISTTLRTNYSNGNNQIINKCTIRKLTPTECMRLQGFINDEINVNSISDSQIYKLAGNGLSINVTEKIFRNLFRDYK